MDYRRNPERLEAVLLDVALGLQSRMALNLKNVEMIPGANPTIFEFTATTPAL
jgi:hypothetical protein